MNTTLLLDCFLDERRLAIIENGITQYFHLFTTAYTHTHQIYLGRVIDINTQLNAVFIDLGNGQSGLLQARSARSLPLLKSQTAHGPEKRSDLIEDYVHQGQAILVQVLRASHNKKGPKLTTSITLTHPLMMYHPLGRSISIPKRLENEDRQRLKTFADNTLNGEMGLSFRRRATGYSDDTLTQVITALQRDWQRVLKMAKTANAPICLSKELGLDLPPWLKTLEDILITANADANQSLQLICNNADDVLAIRERTRLFLSADRGNNQLQYLNAQNGVFSHHNIEDQWEQLLDSHCPLPDLPGAWISIEHTTALTAIDVNMGSAQPHHDQQEAILKLNLAAAKEISRQIRLRNIGGLIVIDFVDMLGQRHKEQLLATLDHELARDQMNIQRSKLSHFGLLELSRPAQTPCLTQQLARPTPRYLHPRPATSLRHKLRQLRTQYQSGDTAPLELSTLEAEYLHQDLEGRPDICHLFTQQTGITLQLQTEKTS